MKKIIFLDIDGVLNVMTQKFDEFGQLFHKQFEDNLRYIIEQTGADIVISSTWRFAGLEEMQRMWEMRDLAGKVIDITPFTAEIVEDGEAEFHERVERGMEIQSWLNHNPCDRYVIIDDDNDMLSIQQPFFVRTANNRDHPDCVDIGYGLTRICAEKAITILNSEHAV